MTADLFPDPTGLPPVPLAPGAVLLPGRARGVADGLLAAVGEIASQAPFRHFSTPGGRRMSVLSTNCGALGWVSDRRGYRYAPTDPETGLPWPALPAAFLALARETAAEAGFDGFVPDACLVNRYVPGAGMTLHQDRDERDFAAPIVSVSLGLPATFLLGGDARGDRVLRVALSHGDVVVFGGPARLRFHGIAPVRPGACAATGDTRVNLTLRRAG